MYEDIPINIYSIVQIIGKIKDGGLRGGLFNGKYPDIFSLSNEDIAPVAGGIRIEMIRVPLFFIFI